MAFILVVSSLGVLPRISNTSLTIWMKLWGCLELTLKLYIVIFSTSVSDLELVIQIGKIESEILGNKP